MIRWRMLGLAGMLMILPLVAVLGASEKSGPVLLLEVRGTIDPAMARYVSRGLEQARHQEAAAVIIELDTPGGFKRSTQKIVQEILDSSIPVLVHVTPEGAQAGSISSFIPIAAHVAAMAPGTTIGRSSAKPASLEETIPLPEILPALGAFRSMAESRGRHFAWAQTLLSEKRVCGALQARAEGAIDLVVRDRDQLMAQAEGRQIRTVLGLTLLNLEEAPQLPVNLSWVELGLHGLAHPVLAYLVLLVGMLFLNLELVIPRTMLPGLVGIVLLLLALVLLSFLNVHWVGLLLILFSNLLFVADSRLSRLRLLALAGIVTFALGSLQLFPAGHEAGLRLPWQAVIWATGLIAAFFLSLLTWRGRGAPPE